MHESWLALLGCPYCGTRLSPVDNAALTREGPVVMQGVLGCECCAFPIVAGIPVLIADDPTRDAMHALEAGDGEAALLTLLGLADDPDRAGAFRTFLASREGPTYRNALEILSPDAEGTYFLYRLSDPTYVMSEALLRVVAGAMGPTPRPRLDLCGGSGHLTRALMGMDKPGASSETMLADVAFWKLWLAKRFTAPLCTPLCFDANHPLPLVRDAFSQVVLSDAFPYIWHKRLLAEEMMRITAPDGVILMPHIHSALGENFAAGDTLTPGAYRDLFAPMDPRLFSDAQLLEGVLDEGIVDLSADVPPDALNGEASFTLVASRRPDLFARGRVSMSEEVRGELRVNPLYTVAVCEGLSRLTLSFPSREYAEEFEASRRYLPQRLTLTGDLTGPLTREALGSREADLRMRRVILDLPKHYC